MHVQFDVCIKWRYVNYLGFVFFVFWGGVSLPRLPLLHQGTKELRNNFLTDSWSQDHGNDAHSRNWDYVHCEMRYLNKLDLKSVNIKNNTQINKKGPASKLWWRVVMMNIDLISCTYSQTLLWLPGCHTPSFRWQGTIWFTKMFMQIEAFLGTVKVRFLKQNDDISAEPTEGQISTEWCDDLTHHIYIRLEI